MEQLDYHLIANLCEELRPTARCVRDEDHVTLTQSAVALAVATNALAVPSRTGSKLQPDNALGNRARASMSR